MYYVIHIFNYCITISSSSSSWTNKFVCDFRNYYNPECLAGYGGPVDPAIALGGFLDAGETLEGEPRYEKATAVILTFLVNNYHNKTKLGPALEWEHK